MRNQTILLSVLAALTVSGCQQVECAQGTIERDGKCEPADNMASSAVCGPFTELQGDRCVPMFPPTQCDPGTTEPDVDPETGVTTCIGTVSGGCSSSIPCPTPSSATKMTICGQLYDFETGMKFADTSGDSGLCDSAAPTADGPCALTIQAYDAVGFVNAAGMGMMPSPLSVGNLYIDGCGRFKLADIDLNAVASPFVGLGIDDAMAANRGPGGVSVTAAVAMPKQAMGAVKNVEAFIVKPSTTSAWAGSGGPTLTTGIYAPVFRQHKAGNGDPFANQAGVKVVISPNTSVNSNNDFYFEAQATARTTIDPAATVTGANGTALINNAKLSDGTYEGQGGLGAGCRWEPHAAASLPGIVFVQIFRKLDILGQTCND